MNSLSVSVARRILLATSWLVPAADRRQWLQAWFAELTYLDHARRERADRGMPGPLKLALGALPHSLWERKEWTVAVLLQDVRFATRVLRANPTFTAMAVLTLALGIGANTTIFSMTNATLLRSPAAIEDSATVVQIGRDRPDQGFDNLAYPYYRLFRDNASSLESVAAWTSRSAFLGEAGDLTQIDANLVTGEYFDVLGIQAAAGRLLSPADDSVPGGHPVVVLSYSTWERMFAADPRAVGTEVRLNGYPYTIVGVAPAGFGGTDVLGTGADAWVPMSMVTELLGERYDFVTSVDRPGMSWLWFVGRLQDAATEEHARDELTALYAGQFRTDWGESPDHGIGVISGVGLRPEERSTISAIMGILSTIVGVVLIVACANLANLLLARGVARTRELAVRAALGAGRVRIVRQLLTESLIVALSGGVVAFLVTFWTARALPLLLPVDVAVSFRPDLRVFGFGIAVSVVAGIVFGVVPALRASRPDVVDSLKDGSAGAGRRAGWLRNGLVVGQLGLSFVLLATTALLVRSLWAAQTAEPGYETQTVSTLTFNTSLAGLDEVSALQLYDQLGRDVGALPGVDSVALASNLPFGGWSRRSVIWPQPRPEAERPFVEIDWTKVTPGFHETLQIPLLSGTDFDAQNSAPDMPLVVILSESAATLLFGEEDPIGALIPRSEERNPDDSFRVIGVVADAQMRSLQQPPRPSIYAPVSQDFSTFMTIYARTRSAAVDVNAPMRAVLASAAPEVGVLQQGSLHQRMGESLDQTTMVARLAAIFGGLAALLAGTGLYGVVAFVASNRRREVGVRMALGARRTAVVGLFVRQAMVLAAAGVLIGVALTLALQGAVSNLLFGIAPGEPVTLAVIGIGVLALAFVAAFAPAYRATGFAPVAALRQD